MTVRDAADALVDALATIDGLRVYRDLGATVEPPAVLIGAPALGWRSFGGPAPTSARFPLFVVCAADEWALSTLWELVPRVAAAVESHVQAAAVQDGPAAAQPTTVHTSGVELPAYELTIEVDL